MDVLGVEVEPAAALVGEPVEPHRRAPEGVVEQVFALASGREPDEPASALSQSDTGEQRAIPGDLGDHDLHDAGSGATSSDGAVLPWGAGDRTHAASRTARRKPRMPPRGTSPLGNFQKPLVVLRSLPPLSYRKAGRVEGLRADLSR